MAGRKDIAPDLVSRVTERLTTGNAGKGGGKGGRPPGGGGEGGDGDGRNKRAGFDLVQRYADKFRKEAARPPQNSGRRSPIRDAAANAADLNLARRQSYNANGVASAVESSPPAPAPAPAEETGKVVHLREPRPESTLPPSVPLRQRNAAGGKSALGETVAHFPSLSRPRIGGGGGSASSPSSATATAPTEDPIPEPEIVARRPLSRRVAIDFTRLEKRGYLTPTAVKTSLAEQYRMIKRPLLKKAFLKDENAIMNGTVIMITSSHEGEGKSFTAINLALSMASERDLYVMLIDSDIYNQSVLRELNIDAKKGLSDLLLDDSLTIPEVLLRTNIPNLSILPAGQKHGNATELLASQRMRSLVDELVSRYPDRVMIIDTPAALHNTEPSVMSNYVGQILIVVEYNTTNWRDLERTVSMMTACPEINFIINKANAPAGAASTPL